MRQTLLAGNLLLSAAVGLAQELSFPYTAYVQVPSTALRSGPGHEFYSTELLDWGTKLEVHRHDDQEWAAVRPPDGSFSWVPASAVEGTDDPTLVRVVQAGTFTRVGTRYSHEHSAEYVPLDVGEVLETLGQQRLPSDSGHEPQLWFKIVPPAGEFRWVRRDVLDSTPPVQPAGTSDIVEFSDDDAVDMVGSESTPARRRRGQAGALRALDASPSDSTLLAIPAELLAPPPREPAETAAAEEPPAPPELRVNSRSPAELARPITPWEAESGNSVTAAQWSYALSPRIESDLLSQRPAPSPWREVERFASVPYVASTALAFPAAAAAARATMPESSQEGRSHGAAGRLPAVRDAVLPGTRDEGLLQWELADIELQLAMALLGPASHWRLHELRARAQAVIDASQIADYRQEAHRMLAKIAQCEDLHRRQRQDSRPGDAGYMAELPAGVEYQAAPPGQPGPGPARYDGQGWLMPVVTHYEGLPRYVLTDDAGQVLQFVTPQPGLNLQGYLRRKIGVFGQQSYLPSVQRPHLTAQRVVSLDRLRY